MTTTLLAAQALSHEVDLRRIEFPPAKRTFDMSILRKKLKVLDSIVIPLPIQMMNAFTRFQMSTEMFFHNKMVFFDISIRISTRVIRLVHEDISLLSTPASFPGPTLRASGRVAMRTFATTVCCLRAFCAKLLAAHYALFGQFTVSAASRVFIPGLPSGSYAGSSTHYTTTMKRTGLPSVPAWWTFRDFLPAIGAQRGWSPIAFEIRDDDKASSAISATRSSLPFLLRVALKVFTANFTSNHVDCSVPHITVNCKGKGATPCRLRYW